MDKLLEKIPFIIMFGFAATFAVIGFMGDGFIGGFKGWFGGVLLSLPIMIFIMILSSDVKWYLKFPSAIIGALLYLNYILGTFKGIFS